MTVNVTGSVNVAITSDEEKTLMITVLNYGKDNITGLSDAQKAALAAVAGALNSTPSLN